MKSKNKASLVFKAVERSLELGLRFFPLLLVMFLGFPLESAHNTSQFIFFFPELSHIFKAVAY